MSNKLRRFQHGVIVFILTATSFFNSYIAAFADVNQISWNNGIRRSADVEKSWAKKIYLLQGR